jgi:hypothetical protein
MTCMKTQSNSILRIRPAGKGEKQPVETWTYWANLTQLTARVVTDLSLAKIHGSTPEVSLNVSDHHYDARSRKIVSEYQDYP